MKRGEKHWSKMSKKHLQRGSMKHRGTIVSSSKKPMIVRICSELTFTNRGRPSGSEAGHPPAVRGSEGSSEDSVRICGGQMGDGS